METGSRTVRAAVAQPQAVPFDTAAALESVHHHAGEAAAQGAQLVVFPEAFVGGYPWGLSFGTAVGSRSNAGRRLWQRYHEAAIDVPGPATHALGEAARETNTHLVVGVIERDRDTSGGTLYCTILYFAPDGSLLGKHRKLKPTAAERYLWGEGDGSTLAVVDTEVGRVGGLICWENYMPLARMALYAKGVEIWVAPTADGRERWQATLRHIALEGRCFVLGANQYATKADYPTDLDAPAELAGAPDTLCRGGSAIYGPLGDCLAGPLWDQPGLLFADLDLAAVTAAKFDFDVTGHYARPDVFRLSVNEHPTRPVDFGDEP